MEYEFRAGRASKCPYHQSHRRSWSYSLPAQLLPFVERVVQITFAATSGAGGYSIGPSLRYFGIVERSNSPAFQLFDDFSLRCARKIYISPGEYYGEAGRPRKGQVLRFIQTNTGMRWSYFDWNRDLLKTEMQKLHRNLLLLFSTGRSSASNSDEFGNTLLHVGFYLLWGSLLS